MKLCTSIFTHFVCASTKHIANWECGDDENFVGLVHTWWMLSYTYICGDYVYIYGVVGHILADRSQMRWDHPPSLSIFVRGGKETNQDSLSNGEWSGKSSNLNPSLVSSWELWVLESTSACGLGLSLLECSRRRGWEPRLRLRVRRVRADLHESGCLGLQP